MAIIEKRFKDLVVESDFIAEGSVDAVLDGRK